MDTNYKQPIESFNTFNKNQTTLWEHSPGKQCGPGPQPTRQQQGQLIWTEASSYGKYRKTLTINIVGWLFCRLVWNRPRSCGKVPPHRHKSKTIKKIILWASPSISSSARGPTHLENIKSKDKQLIVWAGSSRNSSGTGPAHLLDFFLYTWI